MASTKSRALGFDKPGKPEEVLKIVERDVPKQVKENELLLKMRAAALHPSDFLYVEGQYIIQTRTPDLGGAEGVGVVQAVGSNVKDVKLGQRVAVWTESYQTGTWGEYFVFDTTKCQLYIVVPDEIRDEVACQLILNPLTLLGMLDTLQSNGMKQGDWLAQTAAGSSLGRMMIQIAKMKGFKTANIIRRESQINELKKLGGDEVVLQNEKLVDTLKQVTNNEVKFGIDPVGGDLSGQVINSFGDNGMLLMYGFLSGKDLQIQPMNLLSRQIALKGFYISLFAKNNRDKAKQHMLDEIVDIAKSGKVDFPSKTFKLDDFKNAIKHANEAGKAEKSVLVFQ